MKKNILGNKSFNSRLPPCPNSLFANKQAKEHVLEELKKGTLFQHNTRVDPKDQPSLSSRHQDGRCWLNEIKLGIEQPCDESETHDADRGEMTKSMKGLPRLYKKPGFQRQNSRNHLKTRCNKITCLSRKLACVGAWNEENSNSISQNVSKLEQSLLLGQNDLTQNDFQRVEGLHFNGKSLESSIHSLHSSSLVFGKAVNPFSQFPQYSSTIGDWSEFKKRSLRRKKYISRCKQTEGHYVPSFLLQSLYVQTYPKA